MPNDFLEKTLEEIVFENLSTIPMRGMDIFYKNTKRQFYLPSGKKIDLFTWEVVDNKVRARIIELKRDIIGDKAYWQALEYHSEVVTFVLGNFDEYSVEIILVGSSLLGNVMCALATTDDVKVFTYKYDYNGLMFSEWKHNRSFIKSITSSDIPIQPCELEIDFCKRLRE